MLGFGRQVWIEVEILFFDFVIVHTTMIIRFDQFLLLFLENNFRKKAVKPTRLAIKTNYGTETENFT